MRDHAVLRRRKSKPSGEPDPDLKELRDAGAKYHRLCIDVQQPFVAVDELRLDEIATAVDRLASTIARLRERGR